MTRRKLFSNSNRYTHTSRAFGVLVAAVGLLGVVPTELSAQTFVQYKGAYGWPQNARYPTTWRTATPKAGVLLPELRDVEQESIGWFYLATDGTLYGNRDEPGGFLPTETLATGVSGIVDIEAGSRGVYALTSSGEVWNLGNPYGTATTTVLSPVRLAIPPIKQLALDGSQFFAVSTTGGLYAFNYGENRPGPFLAQTGV